MCPCGSLYYTHIYLTFTSKSRWSKLKTKNHPLSSIDRFQVQKHDKSHSKHCWPQLSGIAPLNPITDEFKKDVVKHLPAMRALGLDAAADYLFAWSHGHTPLEPLLDVSGMLAYIILHYTVQRFWELWKTSVSFSVLSGSLSTVDRGLEVPARRLWAWSHFLANLGSAASNRVGH